MNVVHFGHSLMVGVPLELGSIRIWRGHNRAPTRPDDTFERAFRVREGHERLTEAQRQALLDFVREFNCVRLQSRDDLDYRLYPVCVVEGMPTVLTHEAYGRLTVERIRVLFHALDALATKLEAG